MPKIGQKLARGERNSFGSTAKRGYVGSVKVHDVAGGVVAASAVPRLAGRLLEVPAPRQVIAPSVGGAVILFVHAYAH